MGDGEPVARHRNEELVSRLEASGALRERAVAGAFRAVLRHHFLPGRPLDEVYEDAAIMTKTGEGGVPISSSSQPAIMAIMLQLLRLRRGHRVLEIGAGTGYNAALISRLVGPEGRVTTLDIDDDLVAQARANLAAAGIDGVEVVRTDGTGGWPAGAPFDRVIVTAGADDLSPQWVAQLVEDGRLVLPLGLARPAQHCLALVKRGRIMESEELCQCGFMPLRGGMAPASADLDARLVAWLDDEPRPAGYEVPVSDLRAGLGPWLALVVDGPVLLPARAGLPARFGWRDERGVALIGEPDENDMQPLLTYGDGDSVVARLIEAHRAWTRAGPALDRLRITAVPTGEEPAASTRRSIRVVRRRSYTFVVSGA